MKRTARRRRRNMLIGRNRNAVTSLVHPPPSHARQIRQKSRTPRAYSAALTPKWTLAIVQMQYASGDPEKASSALPKKPDIVRPKPKFSAFYVFMARKNASTVPEEEFEAAAEARASTRAFDESPLDARMLDLDDEAESPFLRGQKRVPVRRGALPRKAIGRIKLLLIVLLVVGLVALVAITLYRYGTQSWSFRIDSSDNIALLGDHNVTRAPGARGDRWRHRPQHLFRSSGRTQETAGRYSLGGIGHSDAALSQSREDRAARAYSGGFRCVNSHIALIDAHGVIMDMPPGAQTTYSFPVIVGMRDNEPLSTRAPRMKIYAKLVQELDSTGAHYSQGPERSRPLGPG